MKKALFSLVAIFAMFAMAACGSSDTEKKLNGKWQTEMTQQGQQMTMSMDLNAETHKAILEVSVSMEGMEMATIGFQGKWKASDKEITFSLDDDKCDVTFSEAFKEMAQMGGVDLSDLEEEVAESVKGELSGMAKEEIISLTDNELVVKEDATKITFTRVK